MSEAVVCLRSGSSVGSERIQPGLGEVVLTPLDPGFGTEPAERPPLVAFPKSSDCGEDFGSSLPQELDSLHVYPESIGFSRDDERYCRQAFLLAQEGLTGNSILPIGPVKLGLYTS